YRTEIGCCRVSIGSILPVSFFFSTFDMAIVRNGCHINCFQSLKQRKPHGKEAGELAELDLIIR
ncbi:MAG: hypothetical protein ACI39T_05590, partial [Candidatus Cryptobacteroides sp.]